MSHYPVKIGMTDKSVFVYIPDPASTDGSGKTGLVAANLTVSGSRMETDNDATVTDYTSSLNNLASLTAAHNDWGVLEVSSTLAPGLYRLDIADAIFATGAWEAVVYVMITTSAAAAAPLRFLMMPDDPYTGVNVSQINAVATTSVTTVSANVGTTQPVNFTGTGASALAKSDMVDVAGAAVSTTTAQIGVNVVQLSTDATAADNAEAFFDGTGYAGTNNVIPSVTTVTGNVNGSIGSVTGLTASNLDATVSSRATPAQILTTALTEAYAADGAAPTLAQAIFAIQQFLQERAVAGTTLTVNKLDGSTAAMTFTLGDATDPTTITRAT